MTLKTDHHQVGVNVTATNNFLITTDGAGALKIQRGNVVNGVPTPTQDILTVDSSGFVTVEQAPVAADSSKKVPSTAWVQSLAATGARTPVILPVSVQSGSLADASCTGYFRKVGRFVQVDMLANIPNNGTGAGAFRVLMPWVAARTAVFAGRENLSQGFMLQGILNANSDLLTIYKYDGLYPGGTGYGLQLSGWYEATT